MEFSTPKNFKNGKYIMNRFRWSDLILLFGGIVCTVVLFFSALVLIIVFKVTPFILFATMIPLGIVALLTLIPATIKHNSIEVMRIAIDYKKRRKFLVWEGVKHFDTTQTEE